MPLPVDDIISVPIFKGLSTVELEEVASLLELSEADSGTALIQEGDNPDHPIYVLLSGTAEVSKRGPDGREHLLTSLMAPSVFGEIEVLSGRRAIASVRATNSVRLALLGRGVFDEMRHANSTAVLKVVHNLSVALAVRLASTDDFLATYFGASAPDGLDRVRKEMYSGW